MAAARVLVVDDEPAVLDVTARILAGAGYEVLRASGGRTALQLVVTPPPVDLVVSDVVMPGMPGPELLEAVKQASPSTAFMLMSGHLPDAIPQHVPVLPKPFSAADLLAAVQSALAQAVQARLDLASAREQSERLRRRSEQLRSECARLCRESDEAKRAAREILERSARKSP